MAESIEIIAARLEDHIDATSDAIKATNSKLDQLITLNTQMASLAERQLNHGDAIRRIEARQSEDAIRMTRETDRFEAKLLAVETSHKYVVDKIFARIELVLERKTEECTAIKKLSDDEHKSTKESIKEVSDKIDTLSNDYHAKTNFSRGVIWVLGIAFALSQIWVGTYISDSKDRAAKIAKTHETITSRLNETDQAIDNVRRDVLSIKKGK